MESVQIKSDSESLSDGSNRKKIFFDENGLPSQDVVSLCTQEKLNLSSWGLPEKVLEFYKGKGITHMFQWQLECLTLQGVLDTGNLVYTAPTSAGKTLVAEILISKTIFEIQKKALVILPFVSVVREKMFYFQGMYGSSGIHVEGYMGGHTPSIGYKQVHVAVCTIEKANAIINKLLEEKNLQNLGLVVVDELHLLGDPYRGYLLELLLTKLKYISLQSDFKIQMVGMSATLPNLKSLADWLQAKLYYTEFRPVPLKEKLKCGTVLYDKELNEISKLTLVPSEGPDDAENVCQLCVETIANDHSVLIFCPTKVWCENLADKISLFFKQNGCSKAAEIEGSLGWILRKQLNLKKLNEVIEHLKMSPVGLDKNLHRTIAYGVAFHHAGLTLEERDIIEGSFRKGYLRVLCATSTLSSGVNLPARRVIIRSPMSFGGLMDTLVYRQMIGRAGRMGVDSEGESILICKPNEKAICQTLMCSTLKPIKSCLGHGRLSASLKRALLEIIASGMASTPEEVNKYANCTFLAFSSKHDIEDPIKSCIEFLEENEFIRLQENGSFFAPTPLGKACLASSLPPDEGLALFRELLRARRCFVLDTDLHIIYQVTPYSVSEQWTQINWLNVLNILESIPPSMKRVGEMVGVEEGFLVRVVKGMNNFNNPECRNKLSIHRRFYTSLALQDLVNEIPLSEVAEKFECNKGMLQSLQQSAATYAGMVTEFTKCLGWSSVELIFSQFQERLQFGIQRELCDLMRLPLLNAKRARALFDSGFTNLADIAEANILDLENAFLKMVPFQTKKEIAGETSYDKDQRNRSEAMWITGKAELSIRQAVELVINNAKSILELEIDLELAKRNKKIISLSDSMNKSLNRSVINLCSKSNILERNQTDSPRLVHSDRKLNSTRSFEVTQSEKNKEDVDVQTIDNSPTHKELACDQHLKVRCKTVPDNPNCKCSRTPSSAEKEKSMEGENVIDCKMESVSETDRKLPEKNNSSLALSKIREDYLEVKVSSCKNVKETHLSNSKKEEFEFTSSFIFDMIPDYITEGQGNATAEISKINNAKDSNSVFNDSESIDLAEFLHDSQIHNSIPLNISRLSEDMFDKENDGSKKMSTPIPAQNLKKSLDSDAKRDLAQISSPDLFSQSLTFDTQMGRILNFEKAPVQQEFHLCSFNSDDLGFVSDLSPPKLNHNQIDMKSEIPEGENRSGKNASDGSSLFLNRITENLMGTDESERREATKRRIESPDLITDSDESAVKIHHLNKRPKCSFPENSSKKTSIIESPAGFDGSESDDEIMSTPKLEGIYSFDNSEFKKSIGKSRSFNRSLAKKSNQASSVNSGSVTKIKTRSNQLRKIKNEISVRKIIKSNSSIASRCDGTNLDQINIIDVCDREEDFRVFRERLNEQNIIGLAAGCRQKVEKKRNLIGSRIVNRKKSESKIDSSLCQYKNIILDGIAFYWTGNDVYYMSLDDRSEPLAEKINFLKSFCEKKNTIRVFDVKEHIKMVKRCCSFLLSCSFQDPKVGHWLLSEQRKEKNFSAMVLEHLSEFKNLLSRIGSVPGFSGPGLFGKSPISHKTRACVEAYLTYQLIDRQLPLLRDKGMEQAFTQIEMPVMMCLAEMELVGFGISRERILEIKAKLDSVKEALEEKAYNLAGHKFSLSSSLAINKVLFKELDLDAGCVDLKNKKKKIYSTRKQVLEELAETTKHPLPRLILQWRKIRSILSKFVSSLLQISEESTRVFGVSQAFTLTGRISMHEPNLQNTPKCFCMDENEESISINLRDVFVASENFLLVSADYCQIELRMLAHLSGDKELMRSICETDDIFNNIAMSIFGVSPYEVDDDLRQKAKQMCYGAIYGIGSKSLAQNLGLEESEAAILMENFKNKYSEVKNYVEQTIEECRRRGYVSTLSGRRRYLPCINDSNKLIRMEAERQAINTVVQGSAADLIKTAMISWREKAQHLISNGIAIHSVLHLHDELLFEVEKDFVEEVAAILKETMEGAVELTVPTPVKIKTGTSWGRLEIFEF